MVYIVLFSQVGGLTLFPFPFPLIHFAGLRLLQLRMEKEEMEEELGEKIEVLQRELGQARAGAVAAHQVEELKKVLGGWGMRADWGDGHLPHLSKSLHTSVAVSHVLGFQAPFCSALPLPSWEYEDLKAAPSF